MNGLNGLIRAAGRRCAALLLMLLPAVALAQPSFTQTFSPDEIGPGSVSVLTYTISNGGASSGTDLAFTNTLPAGVTFATGANPFSTCVNAQVTAADGGTTISLSEARIGAGVTCTVRVDVTAAAVGTYTNVSGDLTSSLGNSGTSNADLTVNASLIGFSKAFSPGLIQVGAISRLTFTLDGSLTTANDFGVSFSDSLPTGLEVANPPDVFSDCLGFTNNVTAGSTRLDFNSGLFAGTSCTFAVDVTSTAAGRFDNRSGQLSTNAGSAGSANAVLRAERTTLLKRFASNVRPGDTVELVFSLRNFDRVDSLTGLTFSDDLNAMLSGAVATGLPLNNVCGMGSVLSGSSVLTLTGGSLFAEESCQFSVNVQIPPGAASGIYPNTTSAVSGLLSAAVFNDVPAFADLRVASAPRLSKTIAPTTTRPGQTVSIDFILTNVDPVNPATDIGFVDFIDEWIPGLTLALPASGYCGAGSTAFVFTPVGQRRVQFSGASLAAGASCSFSLGATLPPDSPAGRFLNRTSVVSATVDSLAVEGSGSSAELTVISAPSLSKAFIDDPVNGGDTVTLEFVLNHSENAPGNATAISFSDDLSVVLPGLVAVGLPLNNPCGAGSTLSGTGNLVFTGGSLTPATSCRFQVQLQVPIGAAPGDYSNTTSAVSATVAGTPITDGAAASDLLRIRPLVASKSFAPSTVFAGTPSVTLEFTLNNLSASEALTGIFFTDNLSAVAPGISYSGPALTDPCGAGSSLSGTNFLIFVGGNLPPGSSCTFSVTLDLPAALAPGDYGNVTSAVTATAGGNTFVADPASATLAIVQPLTLTKSFIDDPATAGGTVTLEFTLVNNDPANAATSLSFTDDLDAVLSGLAATGTPLSNVCGAGSQLGGSSLLTLTGGSLPAGGTCTFSVTLQIPALAMPGSYLNVTSQLSGTIGGAGIVSDPASDRLVVSGSADFSKSFLSGAGAGGLVDLQFTLLNTDAANALSGLRFTDDLDAMLSGATAVGLPLTNPCGSGSTLTGGSSIALAGGNLPAGGSCSFVVSVQLPAMAVPGGYLNTSSALSSDGLDIAPPATATLVVDPPPGFAKTFAQPVRFIGQTGRLVFVIDNSGSTTAASALDFTDSLPAGLQIAATPNASTTCTGGTLTAAAGGGTVSYTGGSTAAGSTCMLGVDVVATSTGSLVNTSGDLTSSLGNSGAASATLTVEALPTFAKAFLADPVFIGQSTTLQFTIDNSAASQAVQSMNFNDSLPAGLLVASPANVVNGCGGSVTANPGGASITLTNGAVAAGASCQISVDLLATTAGSKLNTTDPLSSNVGNLGVASASMVVNPLPLFGKAFAPGTIAIDGISTLTLSVDNSGSSAALSAIAVTDPLPMGLSVATPSNAATTCTGGTLTAVAGGNTISYSGGSLPAGATCTISVDVGSATSGNFVNVTGDLTSNAGNSGNATATLIVGSRPAFTKQFAPAATFVNQNARLILAIDHSAGVQPATALEVTDNLPAGLLLATPANAITTCTGGTLTAPAGGSTVSYSGGSVAAGASCTIEADVVAATDGSYVNVTGDLQSSLGNSGNASATLTVNPLPLLGKSFTPTQVFVNQTSQLIISIDNRASSQPLSNVAVTDTLPAGMVVANPPVSSNGCLGTLTAVAGSSVVSLSGGSVTAGNLCSFGLNVLATSEGSLVNTTSTLTSNAGSVPPASATLQVEPAPSLTKRFTPEHIFIGGSSSVTLEISNPSALALTNVGLGDALPTGMLVSAGSTPVSDCGGTVTVFPDLSTIELAGGTVAAGASCSVVFDVDASLAGDLVNTTFPLSGSAGVVPAASATLQVNPLPLLSKRFDPDRIVINGTTLVVLTIDNSTSSLPVGGLSLVDNLPGGMFVAAPNQAFQDCGAGVLSANSGSATATYSGGSVAAGATCEIRFAVTLFESGNFINEAGPLQSDAGTANAAATALLNVQPLPLSIDTLGRPMWWLLVLLTMSLGAGALLRRRNG